MGGAVQPVTPPGHFEIIDDASRTKPDVQSRTSSELAEALASVRRSDPALRLDELQGHEEDHEVWWRYHLQPSRGRASAELPL